MIINTTRRSNKAEIMDDFSMEGEILRDALDKIANINQLLGGNKVTLQGVKLLTKDLDAGKVLTIADFGCGNGDMLRMLADFGRKQGLKMKLIGIDANDFTVHYARSLSTAYENISYQCSDIFSEHSPENEYDIILCTLTLHHFSDQDIEQLISGSLSKAKIGFVVNDLHRSSIAYYLFKALCLVFGLNEMSEKDGLISILRGFKKEDLERFSKKFRFKNYSIKWKWAFRYQWIVKTV
ncbi:methyltransferase domain-containing protein [Dyadobacter flavalbus]|uniref:Methyltransferase domain-containing protein n=1 Tax=Dyadobacter flavalbus TaxID=2579942 RepID=A0A5M8QT73_9BACT|nr:methyltransferase domain-containing protein [Dyadobacter flavalbus]KAA6438458.1 methyltransferase domain-containing protein [Dyadobacter flavalbus]